MFLLNFLLLLQGIYYITAKNSALKRITGITTHDRYILDILIKQNIPCHYRRLFDLLCSNGYSPATGVFCNLLKRCICNGYISKTKVSGNVCYSITLKGKQTLYRFAEELERIVGEQVRKYGNGFPE